MIKPIIRFPNPLLKTISTAIDDPIHTDVQTLIQDMVDTMHAKKGIGLAAIQIGIPKRIFVMQLPDADLQVFINPAYTPLDNQTCLENEGCLSVPNYQAKVKRHTKIEASYTNAQGETVKRTLTDLEAICFQHEYDHLEGIVYIDRLGSVHRTRALNAVNK